MTGQAQEGLPGTEYEERALSYEVLRLELEALGDGNLAGRCDYWRRIGYPVHLSTAVGEDGF
jgi:hypothetical protein